MLGANLSHYGMHNFALTASIECKLALSWLSHSIVFNILYRSKHFMHSKLNKVCGSFKRTKYEAPELLLTLKAQDKNNITLFFLLLSGWVLNVKLYYATTVAS